MNPYEAMKNVAHIILPKKIQSRIKQIKRQRYNNKLENEKLDLYMQLCTNTIPAMIILDPYKKTDRVFDGVQYYSQFYQDYFLDHYIFRCKRGGVFLDIGGNHPTNINNTYFFEKERDWTGIAFEPMPKMHSKWKEERTIECLRIALGEESGYRSFLEYEDQYMSGFEDSVDYTGNIESKYEVKVERLETVLAERNISKIDFVSLDVEGSELEVLKGIDFNKVTIDFFDIENNRSEVQQRTIRKFMMDHGYFLRAHLWIDDIWERIKTDAR